MWTISAGSHLGEHMFFYITLQPFSITPLPFKFHNKRKMVHHFVNHSIFRKGILEIRDNMEKKFYYSLKNKTLIPCKKPR